MPLYRYQAMDVRGDLQRSTLVAVDPAAAAATLIKRGLNPLRISEEEGTALSLKSFSSRIGIVRQREVVIFLRMLTALIASGITITESLSVLYSQVSGRRFRSVLEDLKTRIEGGIALSEALSLHPQIFPEIAVSMVRAGESGGILQESLQSLVIYLEKKATLRRTVVRALIYPAVVLLAAIGVIFFMVAFVIPRFIPLLKGGALPWNTQLLFDLSQFLIIYRLPLGISVVGGAALLVLLFSLQQTRAVLDRYKVMLPIVGMVFRLTVIVQFTRALASLLNSGLPLVESLRLTTDTVTNQAVKSAMESALRKVVAGDPFSVVVRDVPVFTSLTAALFKVGEQSGSMDDAALLLADIYEVQLEDRVALMSTMIEPTLIIFLGGVVGFVAWSLVAGIFSLYSI